LIIDNLENIFTGEKWKILRNFLFLHKQLLHLIKVMSITKINATKVAKIYSAKSVYYLLFVIP